MKKVPLVLLAGICLVLGCRQEIDLKKIINAMFPTIDNSSIQVTGAMHETPDSGTVSVTILKPTNPESSVNVSEIRLTVTSKATGQIIDGGTITDFSSIDAGQQFVGTLAPALPYGEYELLVRGKLAAGDEPPQGDGVFLESQTPVDFTVGQSAQCFTFADDAEGWTLDGIRDIQTSNAEPDGVDVAMADLQCPVAAFNDGLRMNISSACLPGGPSQSGTWAIDFVSGDLSGVDAWQEFATVVCHISSDSQAELKVQPILVFEDENDQRRFFAPGTPGNRILYPIEAESSRFVRWTPPFLENAEVVEFRVRLFIDPMGSQGEGIVATLDAVCLISTNP